MFGPVRMIICSLSAHERAKFDSVDADRKVFTFPVNDAGNQTCVAEAASRTTSEPVAGLNIEFILFHIFNVHL